MKKKYLIINLLLSMAVLFSILFQSIHFYDHYSEQKLTKQSVEYFSKNKTEINSSYSISEKCTTCDFHFSSFTANDFYLFSFYKNNVVKPLTFFFSHQHFSFFINILLFSKDVFSRFGRHHYFKIVEK